MISLLESWDLSVKNCPAQSKEECVEGTGETEGGGAAAGMTESWLCPVRRFHPATPRILGGNIDLTKYLAGMEFQWKAVQTSCATNVHLGVRQTHGILRKLISRNHQKSQSRIWALLVPKINRCWHQVFLFLWEVPVLPGLTSSSIRMKVAC